MTRAATTPALFTDLYELTMAQAYLREGMLEPATFSLYYRELPPDRTYMLACGVEDALDDATRLDFDEADLSYLRQDGRFDEDFLQYLAELDFSGTIRAMPEGTPVMPDEPLVEVTAPLPQAQLLETAILNHVHYQTLLATKAARCARAAQDASVLDFGARRAHGTSAALRAARAAWIGGVGATSLVEAGRRWGVPVAGTMAHSYVQAHEREAEAFARFTDVYPETILLVDTYDTMTGVEQVIALADELGEDFRVRGVRLDSGDLAELAHRTRRRLDEAGLHDLEIIVSGGLDEFVIHEMLSEGAPIDGFGVGTRMGTSADAPKLDMAYKLVEYAGRGRLKLSSGKQILPGAKQVWRHRDADGQITHDVLALADEDERDGQPLLTTIVEDGRRLDRRDHSSLERARARCLDALDALPPGHHTFARGDAPEPLPVERSAPLLAHRQRVEARIKERAQP